MPIDKASNMVKCPESVRRLVERFYIVYELYELSDEEIKIVEEATQ